MSCCSDAGSVTGPTNKAFGSLGLTIPPSIGASRRDHPLIDRRSFVTILTLSMLTAPLAVEAQQRACRCSRCAARCHVPDQQRRVLDRAAKSRLPTIYWSRDLVEAGGFIAYGANFPDVLRQTAFVDKILKGAKPADLPIEQPAKFELVINLKTAKALGADEIIQ
jgi:ABC transporter substrate binding protein